MAGMGFSSADILRIYGPGRSNLDIRVSVSLCEFAKLWVLSVQADGKIGQLDASDKKIVKR